VVEGREEALRRVLDPASSPLARRSSSNPRLFRLALESAPAGSVLHAVGDEGVPIREVAEIFALGLNVPAVSVAPVIASADTAVQLPSTGYRADQR
jgi:hypothetical protein